MAEIVGLTTGIVSLASLFSTCVEAFAYVKAGKSLERNFSILLVKLDVEKARLISWGNAIGIARALDSGRNDALNNPATEETIKSVLESIKLLLTDSDQLKRKYAVEELDQLAQIEGVPQLDLISSTSLSIFKRSYNRLCNRARRQITVTKRVSWAVHDREKFIELVHDLREFVDGLFALAPIAIRSTVERQIEDDISSLDFQDLNLVEEVLASEGMERYQALSDVVSEAIQAKEEQGTIDHWLNNQSNEAAHQEPRPDATPEAPRAVPILVGSRSFMMLTGPCRNTSTSKLPCIKDMDEQVRGQRYFSPRHILAPVEKSWHPSRRIASHIALEDCCNIDRDSLRKLRLGLHHRLLQTSEMDEIDESDSIYFHVANLYVYCPPCNSLIDTAVEICSNMPDQQLLRCLIRIDDRLPCSCFEQPSSLQTLSAIIKEIRQVEVGPHVTASYLQRSRAGYVDRDFLEERIWDLETEQALPVPATPQDNTRRIFGHHVGESDRAGIVLLGEQHCIEPLMRALALRIEPRLPRENEIYWLESRWALGRYFWKHGKICDFATQR